MKTKKVKVRQGFTIVELVIVIGVIGVLTAVLIPTFINLNKKAEMASQQSFLKNVNTQLAMRKAEGAKLETMHDAMEIADEMGFNVEKISPIDGNDIVYDMKANRFAMMKGQEVTYSDGGLQGAGTEIWKIADSTEKAVAISNAGYSIYAKETWNIGNLTAIKVGFDAGNNFTANSVSYVNSGAAQEVVVRTNGGTLTINAASDTVNHYGAANVIDVQNVDSVHSYHEFGEVTKIMFKKGHFVAEASAKVVTLAITASSNSDVEISSKSSAEVFNLASVNGLTGSETNIEVPASTVKVTEAKTAEEIEDIKYGGGSGISVDPYLIYTSLNLWDVVAESNAGAYDVCIKIMSNIDMSGYNWIPFGNSGEGTKAFRGTIDGNEKEIKNMQGDASGAVGAAYGLIASAGHGALVKDLKLSNINLSGKDDVGGFIGTCEKAYNSGEGETSVTLLNCSVSGEIYSSKRSAGLIAVAYGQQNPYKRINISATNCHVDASLSTTGYRAGGLFGNVGDGATVSASQCSFKGSVHAIASGSNLLGTGAIAAFVSTNTNNATRLNVTEFELNQATIDAPHNDGAKKDGTVFYAGTSLCGITKNLGAGATTSDYNKYITSGNDISFALDNGAYTYNITSN